MTAPGKKAVVLLSGGLDSTTLLWHMLGEDLDITALSVQYGQRHCVELTAAMNVAREAGVKYVFCNALDALEPIFAEASSSQVGRGKVEVSEGPYGISTAQLTGVVPNRNMLLLSIAGALAASIGAGKVAYAAHGGDHAIYPDCRPEFIAAMKLTLYLAADVELCAPFQRWSKADIVRQGHNLGAPLALTYSCYHGNARYHCGTCNTCIERREAFVEAGVPDPTRYL